MKKKDFVGKGVERRSVFSDGRVTTTYFTIKRVKEKYLYDSDDTIICNVDDIDKTLTDDSGTSYVFSVI